MNTHDATETAYKNGYKKGYEDGFKEGYDGGVDVGKRHAVKRGQWRKTYTCHGERLWAYECDQCKAENGRASYYCPNCGADMRGADHDR